MKKVSIFLLALLSMNVLFVFSSYATTNDLVNQNALVGVLCNTLDLVTGGTGKTLAAFAVVALGIGFFLGKVSWGLMLAVALGIAALFGAPTIVNALGGGNAWGCEDVENRDVLSGTTGQ
jgi:type IV secretory pathway VirB2 component (pilin)